MINDGTKDLYLIFSLGERLFGLEVASLTEITAIQPISPLADVPEYVKGVINLRNRIIPAIDMRSRLKMEEIPYHERTCILVVNIKNNTVCLLVDSVKEIQRIGADRLESTPVGEGMEQNSILSSVTGYEGSAIMIISLEHLTDEIVFRSAKADSYEYGNG